MASMGELADIGVADLLYLLALRRQTGKLTINANGHEVHLFLEEGQLVLVTSSNFNLRLGRMLHRLGMIEAEQLSAALQEQERTGQSRSLGSILIARGWISDDELAQCIEDQCIEIVARVISTQQGIFDYTRGIQVPRRTEIVPLNADRILLEATRRTDELSTLLSLLPPSAAPIAISNRIDEVADSLTDIEVLVAATLQSGAGSLAELTEHLAMDELTLWRTVISMRERGLLVASEESPMDTRTLPPRNDQSSQRKEEMTPFDPERL